MSDKKEKILIIGKSGSGKDYLMRKLVEKGLKPALKTTTRPKRNFEEQGIHYDFINENNFNSKLNNNEFFCYQSFEVTPEGKSPEIWYYGLTNEEFNNSQVFIMTPNEFTNINEYQRKGSFVVYLDINRKDRENRLHNREDKNDSIKRRLDSDEIDFKDFKDYDLKITDPEFSADNIYELMY